MIHIHMAPDMEVNSDNREFLRESLPHGVRINGYPHGKWEFELVETRGNLSPNIGSVSVDLARIKIVRNEDKSIPEWVIKLAQKIEERIGKDVDVFIER